MNLKKLLCFIFVFFLFQTPIFADIISFESLPEAVSSEENEKEYSFNGTQTIDVDLGELKGVSLTINGTQNVDSVINSTGTYGITLSTASTSAQHLVINNVSGFDNFKSAIVNNKSVSSVTVNNSAFNNNGHSLKGSAIYNLGYLEVNNSTFSLNSSSYGGAVINGDGAVNNIQKTSKAHFDNVLFENNSAQTGGAVFNDVNSTIYMNNVFFSTNTVTGRDDKYGGGAIANKGTITITDNSSFIDNESNISGGAIENSKTLNIYGFTEFIGNNATQTGGAILNSDYNNISTYSNSVNISSGAIFKDNSAKDGGAIDNDGDFFLTANTNDITFINNTASNFGGAIYNRIYSTVDLKTTDTNTISFINNTATERGGAIYAYTGSTTKIGDGVIFSSNSAKIGGAISTITDALFTRRPTIIIGNNVEFSSNTATKSDTVTGSAGGGAIHAYGSDVTIGNDAKFFSNKTVVDGGGAIRNGNSGSVLNIGNNAQFISNSAKEGGALYNINSGSMYIGNDMFLSSNTADNGGAVRNVSAYSYLGENAVFSFNTATQNGGAIHNDTRFTYSQNGHPAEVTINKNTEFNSNTANLKGGAIYNYTYYESLQLDKKATITIQDGAKFINNSSNDNGGAIYNESAILNLIANTVNVEFTGNTANGVSNAIHTSSGIINLWASENADIIFNDRITSKNNTSVLNINSSTTTLTANGKITLNEDMSGYTGTVNLYNGNLVLEDGNSFFNTDNFTVHGGTFTANANNILKGFTNNGTVSFTGGENSNWISGTGKTIIDGEVINSSTIANTVTINAQKKLTTNANNVTSGINNLGNYVITGGENSNWISGTGRTVIDGEVINSSTIANTVTINAQKKLTTKVDEVIGDIENNGELEFNNNGTNSNWISGSGRTIIDGEIINSSTIANAVTINAQKKLTTNATNVNGSIENKGDLFLTGGNLYEESTITGDGNLTIENSMGNYAGITQKNITITNGFFSNYAAEDIMTTNLTLKKDVVIYENGYNGGKVNAVNVNNDGFVVIVLADIANTSIYKGSGELDLTSTNFVNSASISQSTITIGFDSKLTSDASIISGNIENEGEYVITGGENSNWISGTGRTIIDGEIINSSTIANAVTINTNKQLTSDASIISGNIGNEGEYIITGGENSNWISGTGKTIIDGEVINSSTIANAVTINENKQLTTNADNVTSGINNLGNYVITGGENSNWISGTGRTVIDGEVINSSTIANAVTINAQKKLTTKTDEVIGDIENNGELEFNNNGTNSNWISGSGRTIIDGEIINSSTIANAVTINAEKKLTTKVDEITGNIENNGELVFNNNGENSNWISGTGRTIIDGEIINSSTIANTVTINSQKKLTTNAGNLTGEILNNGTLNFIGGVNNNTIIGTNGILVISNDLENNFTVEQSSITINGIVTNNSNMSAENIYLNGTFNVGANGSFFTATNSTVYDGSEINLQNDLIQEHNFGNLTIESGTVNLVVDTDLKNENMDTISASDDSSVNGTINIKAINVLTDTKKFKTEVLFTSSTVLKDKISSINTVSSKLYKYDVSYNDGYFKFINVSNKLNPVIAESAIAVSVGGFATQTNILGQVFSNTGIQISNRNQTKKKSVLYASASNSIFDMENKIERGLWIRPYAVQETIKFNDVDVDNTATGTLAGIDLAASEETLVSFYLGYAGSNQKYEDIKINQTGYVVGATGMLVKEKWYAGLTANINFNKAESQSDYGTDNFDMNMYSVGAKIGYNLDLSDKWILEPNLMLMYGNISSQEYETTQGAKIDSQSTANIIAQPQVKAKLSLDNGWQPYGLLGYVANISDKTKVVVDEIEFEMDKINGYVEYGAGVNKEFIDTSWNCYLQITGRSGGRNGFAGNIGIKYNF